jgi:hypothetical protein
MKEEIHALPSGRGTNVLRSAGNEGEDPSPVAKGEAVMGVMLMEYCNRKEEDRGRGGGGWGGLLSLEWECLKFDLSSKGL